MTTPPKLYVQVELREAGKTVTMAVSQLDFNASDEIIEQALNTASRVRASIEDRLRGKIDSIRKPALSSAPEIDWDAIMGVEPEPLTEIPTETPTEIPETVNVPDLKLTAFGVTIQEPPTEWQSEEITTANVDGSGGGQMLALNSGLSALKLGGDMRHPACLAILQEALGESARKDLGSLYQLNKYEASICLNWIAAVEENPAALDALKSYLGEKLMGGLGAQLFEAPATSDEPEEETVFLPSPAELDELISAGEAEVIEPPIQANTEPTQDTPVAEPEEETVFLPPPAELDELIPEGGAEVIELPIQASTEPAQVAPATETEEEQAESEESSPRDFSWAPDQARAIETARNMKSGEVVFITGEAGSGKSTVIREITKYGGFIRLGTTGIAAINIGGSTIHRFFSLGGSLSKRGNIKKHQKEALRKARGVIIDEVSMCRADVMDAIDRTMRYALENDLPFGGKPMILVGDLWQLEPVVSSYKAKESSKSEEDIIRENYKSPYFFDAHVFGGINPSKLETDSGPFAKLTTIELKQVFRQAGEPEFIDALNKVRVGDPSGISFINAHATIAPTPEKDDVIVCYTNSRAERLNEETLGRISGDLRVYEGQVEGEFQEKNMPSPATLKLKVGARVMVTKNTLDDYGYRVANGSTGYVKECGGNYVIVVLDNGDMATLNMAQWDEVDYTLDANTGQIKETVVGSYYQIPLKLATAITAHKSQGLTLEKVYLALEQQSFAHGQLYVALSRCRGISGLKMARRLTADDLVVSPHVRAFHGIHSPLIEYLPYGIEVLNPDEFRAYLDRFALTAESAKEIIAKKSASELRNIGLGALTIDEEALA